ncbi:MAG: hypothetical protein FWC58_02170, partial [Desulfobulbus sp.]|nr:hypothetical protein [Desulfobulbus sp.]
MAKRKCMGSRRRKGLFGWLKALFLSPPESPPEPVSDIEQARRLLAAIDRGGIPLNPARVSHSGLKRVRFKCLHNLALLPPSQPSPAGGGRGFVPSPA